MKKIRIGNTFEIRWAIFTGEGDDNAPHNLAGKDLSIYLISAFDTIKIENFSTNGNMIMFAFEGKDQRYAGTYQMTLIENEGKEGMRTLDTRDAFELVKCSCVEDDADEGIDAIFLSSELNALKIYPVIPEIGENGNWFIEGEDTGKPSIVNVESFVFIDQNWNDIVFLEPGAVYYVMAGRGTGYWYFDLARNMDDSDIGKQWRLIIGTEQGSDASVSLYMSDVIWENGEPDFNGGYFDITFICVEAHVILAKYTRYNR